MFKRGRVDTPRAGEILSLHADHRRGLHATTVDACTQCLFESLDADAPTAAEAAGIIERAPADKEAAPIGSE
jgi:hypothetical protein